MLGSLLQARDLYCILLAVASPASILFYVYAIELPFPVDPSIIMRSYKPRGLLDGKEYAQNTLWTRFHLGFFCLVGKIVCED